MTRFGKPLLLIALCIVLYLIAMNSGAGWLYVVSALIGAVVVISVAAPLWTSRGIEVVRRAPVVGRAGEPLRCEMEVRNTGRMARHLLQVRDEFAGDVGRTVVARIRGGAAMRVEYTLENPRRGIYSGGEIVVESGAPFGLFHGRRRIRAASNTVIHPRTFDVAALPPTASRDTEQGDRSEASTLHRGHGGEFWGVREYRPGDPARLVSWRRSARGLPSGKLAVRELAQETYPPFVLALNLDDRAPREAREMVVSAGASLLLFALREGRVVRADAGSQKAPFPDQPDQDSLLTWFAGLVSSRPPDTEEASVEIRPSTLYAGKRPGASETQDGNHAVVLVSCGEFTGFRKGPWMTLDEEQGFLDGARREGRAAASLGPDLEEPWRIE